MSAEDSKSIQANGTLKDGKLTATLTLGESTLTLVSPKEDLEGDGVNLIVAATEGFTQLVEALVVKILEAENG